MIYEVDYLDKYIQAPHTTFIGATTYNTGRIRTQFTGIWEGYLEGRNIFEMEFGFTYSNTKFGDNTLAQIKSLEILFRNAYRYMTSETVILVSNQRIIDWMERGQYKWMDGIGVKSQLFTWIDTIKPKFDWYNSLHPPFSILREYVNILKKRDYKDLINGLPRNSDWTDIKKADNILIG